MIGYLKGIIQAKQTRYILINVNNVGYKVFVSTSLYTELDNKAEIELFIYTNVKEDDIALYGFKKNSELQLFEKLISISGIGPRLGLDILGSPIYIIQNAILNNDPKLLTQIKGIGKKTAERVILELKNKIDLSDFGDLPNVSSQDSQIDNDIITALEGLGYEKYQIIKKLQDLPEGLKTPEEKIKWFLQNL